MKGENPSRNSACTNLHSTSRNSYMRRSTTSRDRLINPRNEVGRYLRISNYRAWSTTSWNTSIRIRVNTKK